MVIFQFNHSVKAWQYLLLIAHLPFVEVANKFIIQDKEDW